MEISIASQIVNLLMSLLVGVCLGGIYDLIRIWRSLLGIEYINKFTLRLKEINLPLIKNPLLKAKKGNRIGENLILFLTDILYFLIVTFVLIIFIYYTNYGIVRWYILTGVIAGFFAYYFTLGKIIISFSEYVVFGIKVARSYTLFLVSRPFVPIIRKIRTKINDYKTKARIKSKNKKVEKPANNKRKEIFKVGKSENESNL